MSETEEERKARLDKENDFAQYGFDDTVPILERADNIRNSLVRTMIVFKPNYPVPLSHKEKWAAVLAGSVIDRLLIDYKSLSGQYNELLGTLVACKAKWDYQCNRADSLETALRDVLDVLQTTDNKEEVVRGAIFGSINVLKRALSISQNNS